MTPEAIGPTTTTRGSGWRSSKNSAYQPQRGIVALPHRTRHRASPDSSHPSQDPTRTSRSQNTSKTYYVKDVVSTNLASMRRSSTPTCSSPDSPRCGPSAMSTMSSDSGRETRFRKLRTRSTFSYSARRHRTQKTARPCFPWSQRDVRWHARLPDDRVRGRDPLLRATICRIPELWHRPYVIMDDEDTRTHAPGQVQNRG